MMDDMPVPKPTFETDFDKLKELYDGGMPLSRAASQIGVSAMTASNWMRKAGVEVRYRRTNSEGGIGALRHTCDQCGKEYIATHVKSRFCSRQCTNDWQRAQGRNIICPCGGKVGTEDGNRTYSSAKKYCSEACRKQYGKPTKTKDPANWETYTCRNPNCGQTFERRKNSRNAKHYCSLACSNKMTKTRRFYAIEDFDVVFESSYEAFFWSACMIAKIPVERFDRGQGVAWDPAHPDRWYAPDFWLPRHNAAVEIKGVEDDHDQARWKAFRESGRIVHVISREWLEQGSPQTLAALLDGLVLQSLDTDPKEWVDVDPVSGKTLRRWIE